MKIYGIQIPGGERERNKESDTLSIIKQILVENDQKQRSISINERVAKIEEKTEAQGKELLLLRKQFYITAGFTILTLLAALSVFLKEKLNS